ncbi:MAG: hypothetical protein CVT63_03080 [Candidatus Anoxymicrobium japonicum]|uniref:Methyltransferase domain-containing protein n=1 Tax=Candidatus Anoxymicrobium japonicum TaxID=2013648 RepID=A0A2N3G6P6_9ACTN|nr:MAG: hypothetical protein CVT63_03080 [Candidatus Anoxymicrobium japonicum]
MSKKKNDALSRFNAAEYVPRQYWEDRLSSCFSLQGVGHLAFSNQYNFWYYKSNKRAIARALKRNAVKTCDVRMIDVGIGTGYYIDFWHKRGVRDLVGFDITEKSVTELRIRYPSCDFHRVDISKNLEIDPGKFDILTVFNVLFHVIEEEGFENAIETIEALTEKDSTILIIDNFIDGAEPLRGHHETQRTLARYREVHKTRGMEIVDLVPISFFMNNPIDAGRLKSRVARWIVRKGFRLNTLAAGATRRMGGRGVS